jgi:hypothetical protein
MDDAPRQVAVMARTFAVGHTIPLHIHRRGQLLHAVSGIMRVAAWIVPPARALWLPPQWPHSVTMRSQIEMRTGLYRLRRLPVDSDRRTGPHLRMGVLTRR